MKTVNPVVGFGFSQVSDTFNSHATFSESLSLTSSWNLQFQISKNWKAALLGLCGLLIVMTIIMIFVLTNAASHGGEDHEMDCDSDTVPAHDFLARRTHDAQRPTNVADTLFHWCSASHHPVTTEPQSSVAGPIVMAVLAPGEALAVLTQVRRRRPPPRPKC
jgi:hypothetical protein